MYACSQFTVDKGDGGKTPRDAAGRYTQLLDCLKAIVQGNSDAFVAPPNRDEFATIPNRDEFVTIPNRHEFVTISTQTMNDTNSTITSEVLDQGPMMYVVVVLMVYSLSILAFMASMIHKTRREEESVDDYLKSKQNMPKVGKFAFLS